MLFFVGLHLLSFLRLATMQVLHGDLFDLFSCYIVIDKFQRVHVLPRDKSNRPTPKNRFLNAREGKSP